MSGAATYLPEDIDDLKQLLLQKDQKIAVLEEQLRLALMKRFGASSEKSDTDQLNLFNEAEALNEAAPAEAAAQESKR